VMEKLSPRPKKKDSQGKKPTIDFPSRPLIIACPKLDEGQDIYVAVRSSGTAEDLAGASFAGWMWRPGDSNRRSP